MTTAATFAGAIVASVALTAAVATPAVTSPIVDQFLQS